MTSTGEQVHEPEHSKQTFTRMSATTAGRTTESGASGKTTKGRKADHPASDEYNPWQHPMFANAYSSWIPKLDPFLLREACLSKGLISPTSGRQLETVQESRTSTVHNENLLAILARGGHHSFTGFLIILEEYANLPVENRKELAPLLNLASQLGETNVTELYTAKQHDGVNSNPTDCSSQVECYPATEEHQREALANIGHPTPAQATQAAATASTAAAASASVDPASPFRPDTSSSQSSLSSRHAPSLIETNHQLAKRYDSSLTSLRGSSRAPPSAGSNGKNILTRGGYHARFKKEYPESYKCPVCLLVLREPVQTGCGHRYCHTCIIPIMSGKDPLCPVDREPLGAVFPDKHCQREIANLEVLCDCEEKCGWTGTLKYLEDHLEECQYVSVVCINVAMGCKACPQRCDLQKHLEHDCSFRTVACSACGGTVRVAELEKHSATQCPEGTVNCTMIGCETVVVRKNLPYHLEEECQEVETLCKLGCGKMMKRREMTKHTTGEDSTAYHFQILFTMNARLEQEKRQAQAEKEATQRANTDLRDLVSRMAARVRDLEQRTGNESAQTQQTLARMQDLVAEVAKPKESGRDIGQRMAVVETRVEDFAATASSMRQSRERVDAMDLEWRKCFDNLDLRVFELETASYNGVLMWKFPNFSKHLRNAKNGTKTSHYSHPFYSSRHGYKACARLYPNGDGAGLDNYLSVFFVIMAGEFDPLLEWPYNRRVTLSLLDQSSARRDISETFMPDTRSTSFQRPTSGMNVASGCPCFVSHKIIMAATNQYLRNDTLFLRIKIDTSNLSQS